jgi:hypothetical protein
MRPNIEIPWSIHGQVREYAENNNLSITDAYIVVLKKGLESNSST